MTRPVGHVTNLLRELDKWRQAREAKNLDVRPLEKAMTYLGEYRELLALDKENNGS